MLVGGQVRGRGAQEQVRHFHGVAVRPDGGCGPRAVDVSLAVPGTVEDVDGLRPSGGGELGERVLAAVPAPGEPPVVIPSVVVCLRFRCLPVLRLPALRPAAPRLPSVADPASRVSRRHRPGRWVLGDHRSRPDHAVVPDGDAVDDDHVRADPDVVPDRDAPARLRLAEHGAVRGHGVVEAQERGVGADAYGVAEGDGAADRGEGVVAACHRVSTRGWFRASPSPLAVPVWPGRAGSRPPGPGPRTGCVPRGDVAGDVGVGGDVRVVAEAEVVGVDRRRPGHVAPFAEFAVAAQGLLPLALRGALFLRRLLLEQPGAVVEVPYGCRVIHTAHARQSAQEEGRGRPYGGRPGEAVGCGRVTASEAAG